MKVWNGNGVLKVGSKLIKNGEEFDEKNIDVKQYNGLVKSGLILEPIKKAGLLKEDKKEDKK